MIKLTVRSATYDLAEVFTISRGSKTVAETVIVELDKDGIIGRGECTPYPRYGESVEAVIAQIRTMSQPINDGLDRIALQQALPAGAARNALDCAFWDLEAKRSGTPVWQLADLDEPRPIITAFTLSLDEPTKMEAKARTHAQRPLLKIKLGGEGDVARLEAVRRGAPNADIIVDANEGWTQQTYQELAPTLINLGVSMVEQPFPAGKDDILAQMDRPLPVCADESSHDSTTLAELVGRYDMVNIKLDKTGGLTQALIMKQQAQALGLEIMVGCMVASSLAMAPAFLVAQGVRIADLDGPLLLARDCANGLTYAGSQMSPPTPQLWG